MLNDVAASLRNLPLLAAVAFSAMVTGGCKEQMHARLTESMTWECIGSAPASSDGAPGAQSARFRYVKNPHFEEVYVAPGLCDSLKSVGKIVPVEFEIYGTPSQGVVWYHHSLIGGRKYKIISGSSGTYGEPGAFPLDRDFRESLRRQ